MDFVQIPGAVIPINMVFSARAISSTQVEIRFKSELPQVVDYDSREERDSALNEIFRHLKMRPLKKEARIVDCQYRQVNGQPSIVFIYSEGSEVVFACKDEGEAKKTVQMMRDAKKSVESVRSAADRREAAPVVGDVDPLGVDSGAQ